MKTPQKTDNPFSVTKAVDFSDRQILKYWVDLHDGNALTELADPTSQTPMIIEGGKGSGKTHLMRYLTLTSQLLRRSDSIEEMLSRDQYIGIYVRFSGLNASRFKGKNQSSELWLDVFGYYAELWLGQLLIESVVRLANESSELKGQLAGAGRKLSGLLTERPSNDLEKLEDFLFYLRNEQRSVDHAVNNCGLTGSLNININVNRGGLIFGGSKILGRSSNLLKDITFVFLLDEYENLDVPQQQYVNTLIREKQPPANFKIGTRSYGIRTYKTLSADEILVEGSEFHLLRLDERLRENPSQYKKFCRQIISRRLRESTTVAPKDRSTFGPSNLHSYFCSNSPDTLMRQQTRFVLEKYAGRERPYFKRMKQQLVQYLPPFRNPGGKKRLIATIIENLRADDFPLIEKVHAFQLYRDWSHNRPLLESSQTICSQYEAFTAESTLQEPYLKILNKFKADLFAQLLRQCDQRQHYVGLNTLIAMSSGLPRNLLVVLKHIYTWAEFQGERPFHDSVISAEAQHRGVMDASRWFRENARIPGDTGRRALNGIARLAELFREIRYSDKPSECSVVAFSINREALDDGTREILDACTKWSLLIRILGGQKDKNSMRVDSKFQLSPMIAPLWDLPVSRRGAIALRPEEGQAIFGLDDRGEFDKVLKNRLGLMNVPFRRNRPPQQEITFRGS